MLRSCAPGTTRASRPVANLAAKKPDDWARLLPDLLPAINACVAREGTALKCRRRRRAAGRERRARALLSTTGAVRRLQRRRERPRHAVDRASAADRAAAQRIRCSIPPREPPPHRVLRQARARRHAARRARRATCTTIRAESSRRSRSSRSWRQRFRAGRADAVGARRLYAACSPPPRRATRPTIAKLAAQGANVNATDARGRTPLHVAAFMKQRDAMRALVDAGADPNALETDRYDMVTIAAVADDVPHARSGARARQSRDQRDEPLRRHRAHRGGASRPRRGRAQC